MRPFLNTSALLLLMSLTGAGVLSAQQKRDRGLVEVGSSSSSGELGGFYGTLGLGAGHENYKYSGDDQYTVGINRPTLSLRAGGTPNRRLRVGGEVFLWRNDIDNGDETFATYLMTGQYYFSPKGGPSIRGGAGYGRSGTSYNDGGSAFATGFAFSVGAAWDLKAGRNFYISPTVDLYSGYFANPDQSTFTERVLNVGVQFTLQSGRR